MIQVDKVFFISKNSSFKQGDAEKIIGQIPIAQSAPVEIISIPKTDSLPSAYQEWGITPLKNLDSKNNNDLCWSIGHWIAWSTAFREGKNAFLILEEGVRPSSDHYHVLGEEESWELIYLGRNSFDADRIFSDGGLVIPGYSHGSFAYLISKEGIKKIMNSGIEAQFIPTKEFLACLHAVHPNKIFRSLFSCQIKALAPLKNLVEYADEPLYTNSHYKALHPTLTDDYKSSFWKRKYINDQLSNKEFDLICDEPIDNVFSFPLFTPQFCEQIIEEANHFGEWTNYRNKKGEPIDMLLSSFGLDEMYSHVLREYVYPLFCYKYQLSGKGWGKLVSQNFIVRYKPELQSYLGLHHDGSYLSMIVTLNNNFEGGGTYFPKYKKLIQHPYPGHACIHPGLIGFQHGARPVTKGVRYILASFLFPESGHPLKQEYY